MQPSRIAETIPIPVEGGVMLEPAVKLWEGRWTVHWCHDGGLRKEPVPELSFEQMHLATRAARTIRERIHGEETVNGNG